MLIISIRDNENNRWKRNAKAKKQKKKTTATKKKTKTEKNKGGRSYSERVRAKWFSCTVKLGFPQLICKASLTFKSNLESALSIIITIIIIKSTLWWSVDV